MVPDGTTAAGAGALGRDGLEAVAAVEELGCGLGSNALDAWDAVGGVASEGAEVDPLTWIDAVGVGDGGCGDEPMPLSHPIVEYGNPVADELVEVPVLRQNHYRPVGALASGEGGDQVVGFLVVDFEPGDAVVIEATFGVGEVGQGFESGVVVSPSGLVVGEALFATVGAVLAVEDYHHLGEMVLKLGLDSLAEQGEEGKQTG